MRSDPEDSSTSPPRPARFTLVRNTHPPGALLPTPSGQNDIDVDLVVNGRQVGVSVAPRVTLADALRSLGFTGTRVGCEHGVCGTCTILLDESPVRACLVFAPQASGCRIRTVEGLSEDGALSVLQRAFHEHGALQCGFCTPGFLMLATEILERDPPVPASEVRHELGANLCRCTGYGPIVAAVQSAQAARNPGVAR